MLMSAAVVAVIGRRWTVAAAWCTCAAVLSACGLMHSYQWTFGDTAIRLAPAWPYVIGYSGMALIFYTARWTTEEGGDH
jgi:AGZA family xanthine/uracil permease-like MFS transporter